MICRLLMAILALAIVGCSNNGNYDYSLFPVKGSDSKWGYVDAEGKVAIGYQFSEAHLFRDGLALVKSNGESQLYGYIDKMGVYVVQPKYVSATSFHEGIAFVTPNNGQPLAINTKGETVFTCKGAEIVGFFSYGLACFRNKEGKWGFYNSKGEIVITPQFTQVGVFSEGLCSVRNEQGKWGYMDKEGKIVVTQQFDDALSYSQGHAAVLSSGKWGVIDKDGKYRINPQYNQAYVDGANVLVNQNGKYGWVDSEGKVVINPQFDKAIPFGNGKLAAVESGGKFGYIDSEGKMVIQPQFDAAIGFTGNVAIVVMAGKFGLIDSDGKIAVNPQFELININDEVIFNGQVVNSVNTTAAYCYSDFVDVPAITNAVKAHFSSGKVLGADFNNAVQDLMTMFGKPISDINPYSSTLYCKQDSIGSDAVYSFSAIIDPSQLTAPPSAYEYRLSLKGRAASKSLDIFKELAGSFGSFQKDAATSTEFLHVYKGNGMILTVNTSYTDIVISIRRDIPDVTVN